MSDFISNSKSKFIDNFEVLIKNYNEFISNLSTEQLCNLMSITCYSFILICIFQILIIYFGNYLIDYLGLESKYPKIAKFIRIRKMYQDFNILINILLIVLALIFIIYVNFVTMFN